MSANLSKTPSDIPANSGCSFDFLPIDWGAGFTLQTGWPVSPHHGLTLTQPHPGVCAWGGGNPGQVHTHRRGTCENTPKEARYLLLKRRARAGWSQHPHAIALRLPSHHYPFQAAGDGGDLVLRNKRGPGEKGPPRPTSAPSHLKPEIPNFPNLAPVCLQGKDTAPASKCHSPLH